jgi:hypothetical protein
MAKLRKDIKLLSGKIKKSISQLKYGVRNMGSGLD